MNVAQYVNVLLLSLAFQGYLISVNPPLAISWSRWSLLTPRLLCCQLNPNPFFAGSGPSPFPLAQSDPFGLCILLYPAAFQGWGHPIWPETEVLPLEMGAVEDEKGESWRSHCVTAFVAVFLVRSGNPSEELEWNCSGWGYIFLSILFNEPFYPPDQTEPDRTGDLGIANGSEFFFSFNLKITQEMLNIEKLENMHDQKKEKEHL